MLLSPCLQRLLGEKLASFKLQLICGWSGEGGFELLVSEERAHQKATEGGGERGGDGWVEDEKDSDGAVEEGGT